MGVRGFALATPDRTALRLAVRVLCVMENERSRTFVGLWYPLEDDTHALALKKVKEYGFSYVAICHDKDVDGDGVLKKPHLHIYFRFKQPRFLNAVAKELGIASNYIQICRDSKSAILYLVHANDLDKFQYSADECFGTLTQELRKYLINGDESSRVLQVLDILDELPVPCTYRKWLVACCEANLYGDFRRMGHGAIRLLEEHNVYGKEN